MWSFNNSKITPCNIGLTIFYHTSQALSRNIWKNQVVDSDIYLNVLLMFCNIRQIGVQLSNGKTIRAKKVISNATRWDTFGKPSRLQNVPLVLSILSKMFFFVFPATLRICRPAWDFIRTSITLIISFCLVFLLPYMSWRVQWSQFAQDFWSRINSIGYVDSNKFAEKLLKPENMPEEERNFQKLYRKSPSFLSIHMGVKAEVLPAGTECHHLVLEVFSTISQSDLWICTLGCITGLTSYWFYFQGCLQLRTLTQISWECQD